MTTNQPQGLSPSDLDKAIKEMEAYTIYSLHVVDCKCHRCVVLKCAKQVQELREQVSLQIDQLDLMRDEFQRIKALPAATSHLEVNGICDRAISAIHQNVPVVVQRDKLEQQSRVDKELIEMLVELMGLANQQADDALALVESKDTATIDGMMAGSTAIIVTQNRLKDVVKWLTKAISLAHDQGYGKGKDKA